MNDDLCVWEAAERAGIPHEVMMARFVAAAEGEGWSISYQRPVIHDTPPPPLYAAYTPADGLTLALGLALVAGLAWHRRRLRRRLGR